MRIAVDAMGGDRAPAEIVAGALRAAAGLGVEVLLSGPAEQVREHLPAGEVPAGVELVDCREVIGMADDPAAAVRTHKDASVVRAAELVRDGRADAMVSAGNTGATMAAALLRMGRMRGVARPCVAVPVPVPFGRPQVLVDAGATVDARPEWLEQFARLGRAYAAVRTGVEHPTVGLLSNGEEPGKGDTLRKAAHTRLAGVPGFVGNVEGRDLMSGRPDVIVTDGFTGNVALKTMEGALRAAATLVFRTVEAAPPDAAAAVTPALIEAARDYLDPDTIGGAVLLGVRGICIISHGASSARAIANAVGVAAECVRSGMTARLEEALHAG